MISFEQFLTEVNNYYYNQPSLLIYNKLRYGQIVMNMLNKLWPDKYIEITGSDYDCFYDNATVKLTLNKLEKDWSDYEKQI